MSSQAIFRSVGALEPAQLLGAYRAHLRRSALATSTQAVYLRHASGFISWLAEHPEHPNALHEHHARDFACRDYVASRMAEDLAPASVASLAAGLGDLYRFIGLGPPERLPRPRPSILAPRALDDGELRRLLRALEAAEQPRDRAVVALMVFAGLRVSEVAALDVRDVVLSARSGVVHIRHTKADQQRHVPIPAEARCAVGAWLAAQPGWMPSDPLFPGPSGRLSVRAMHRLVARLGSQAGLVVSPHGLRHTYLTRLVRQGKDLVLVAELAGHARIETTRRYVRPSAADAQAAVEDLALDY